ncbi:RCC1 domain-containing protein 1 [Portunus trituberculatus]|uniref:RCC1 domain-containing protein 1 n=1 Tax=Portunus trituberculatus TaxID=210409 RepID=A0A5B7GEB3_PORTR|nr:RCC1 domain-containing protein 1 [Portunus trituberculatus]
MFLASPQGPRMSVLACGLNTSGQVMKAGPGILCCPSPVAFPSGVTAASIAFSHILWRTDAGWQWTGYDSGGSQGSRARGVIKSSWKVCVCENRIAAINDDGSVLVWENQWRTLHFQKRDTGSETLGKTGVMYCGSVPVPLRVKMKEVAVGKEHSMALTAAGDIITWGSGMRGQLGIGELCQAEMPVPVESLQGVPITTIACGAWHCTALSETGDLYVWGWNESGQLGYPYNCEGSQSLFLFFEHACQCPERKHVEGEPLQEENKGTEEGQGVQTEVRSKGMQDKRINPKRRKEVINVQASPVLLDFWTEDVNITNVRCGDRHTLYMLDDGSVWSAGMNR